MTVFEQKKILSIYQNNFAIIWPEKDYGMIGTPKSQHLPESL